MSESASPVRPSAERKLVLDDLAGRFDQFRLLRSGGDTEATAALLDELGAQDPVEQEIVLELSATRPLGVPSRFEEAHEMAMHAIEVLDRNGARAPGVPRLGPLTAAARYGVGLVVRFIVRNHQAQLVDAIGNLYARRLAWCGPQDQDRRLLAKARHDVTRVASTYKANPIGVPAFLLGGAVISGATQAGRLLAQALLGSQAGAVAIIVSAVAVIGALSWCILRGAAVARHRIRLTVAQPIAALWQTIGRCGAPPRDASRSFVVVAIALTVLTWVVVPLGVLFVVARF